VAGRKIPQFWGYNKVPSYNQLRDPRHPEKQACQDLQDFHLLNPHGRGRSQKLPCSESFGQGLRTICHTHKRSIESPVAGRRSGRCQTKQRSRMCQEGRGFWICNLWHGDWRDPTAAEGVLGGCHLAAAGRALEDAAGSTHAGQHVGSYGRGRRSVRCNLCHPGVATSTGSMCF